MGNVINIEQTIKRTGKGSYDVIMNIKNGSDTENIEFNYSQTNGIFPLYNSLINVIRKYENVHIELTTNNKIFAKEIKGSPNRNTSLLNIYIDIQKQQGVTLDVIDK